MSGAMRRPQAGKSTVAIKRVIRQNGVLICGVCRKSHATMAAAERCLDACLHRHMSGSTTSEEVTGQKKRYRCHFCRRLYEDKVEAQNCAASCKKEAQRKVEAHRAIDPRATSTDAKPSASGKTKAKLTPATATASAPTAASTAAGAAAGPVAVAPLEREPTAEEEVVELEEVDEQGKVRKVRKPIRKDCMHKFLRDGRKLVCRKCGKEHPTLDTVIACYDAHPANEGGGANNNADKFMRDGAKYVCRKCSKKYFTQDDVVKCFDGHGNEAPAAAATAAPAATPAAAPSEGPPPAAKSSGLKDDEMFMRDGAKYVCRKCSAKYFTRGDVIACFEKH